MAHRNVDHCRAGEAKAFRAAAPPFGAAGRTGVTAMTVPAFATGEPAADARLPYRAASDVTIQT